MSNPDSSPRQFSLPSFLAERRDQIVLTALILALSISQLMWLHQDHGKLPHADGYCYLVRLLRFMDSMNFQSLLHPWDSLRQISFGGRPPLYSLLTMPAILLFGRSEDAALGVNIFFHAALMILCYSIGRSISGSRAGLLAALLAATYPPIVHLSRNFIPYAALPTCCALVHWALLRLLKHRSIQAAWLFGASLAFGIMVHSRFVYIVAVPTIVFSLYIVFFQQQPRRPSSLKGLLSWAWDKIRDPLFSLGLLPGALLTIVAVVPWHMIAARRLFEMAKRLDSGAIGDFRGYQLLTIGFQSTEPTFWWYLKTAPGAISHVFTVFAILGILLGVLKRRLPIWLLVTTLVASYTIFSRMVGRSWWSFSMVLPIAAILTAVWIAELHSKKLSQALSTVCVVVALFNYSVVTWGLPPSLEPLAATLGAPLDLNKTCNNRMAMSFCPAPPRPTFGQLAEHEVVDMIFEDPACRSGKCQLMKLGGSVSWVHLNYLVLEAWPGSQLKVVNSAKPRFGNPYNMSSLFKSDYLLYPVGPARKTDIYQMASVKFLQSPPPIYADAHQEVAIFDQPGNRPLKLIKRIAPLTSQEVEISIAALDLDPKYHMAKYWFLANLYKSEGNLEKLTAIAEEVERLPAANSRLKKSINRVLEAGRQRQERQERQERKKQLQKRKEQPQAGKTP